MTDPADSRHYTDREVQLILKSAVELQAKAEQSAERTGGMTLAELEQIAREAGLDPGVIRTAAARLDERSAQPDSNAFLGSPQEIVVEQSVDVPVDTFDFDQLLDVIRAMSREVGEVSTVGRQFGWKGKIDGVRADVSVSAGERRTTFRVRFDLEQEAIGHFMVKGTLVGGMGGLLSGVAASDLIGMGPAGLAVGAGVLLSGYLWARRGLRLSAAGCEARGQQLIEALSARAVEIHST